MPVALISHPDSGRHDTGWQHPEHVGRVRAIPSALKFDPALFHALLHHEARHATAEELALVHDPAYVERVRTMAAQGGGAFDQDTLVSDGSWDAGTVGVGAALDGVAMAFDGRARRSFCATRPPGHHAVRDRGMGFCLFGNVAVAAQVALQRPDVERVLIVDWDVHHGNGTQALVEHDPRIRFVSLHQWPWYPGTGRAEERGPHANCWNLPMARGLAPTAYLDALWRAVDAVTRGWTPDLLLLSSGFDCLAGDPLGGFTLTTAHVDALTREFVGARGGVVRRTRRVGARGRLRPGADGRGGARAPARARRGRRSGERAAARGAGRCRCSHVHRRTRRRPGPLPAGAIGMTRRALSLGLALAASAACACGEAPPAGRADAVPATTVRDSAGVRIVASGFVRTALAADERLAVRDTLIDAARDGDAFTSLRSVQPLADGALLAWIADGSRLLRVGPPAADGRRPVDTLAAAGPDVDGSGTLLLPYTGDTVLLWDGTAGRVQAVTAAGVARTVTPVLPDDASIAMIGAFAGGAPVGYAVVPPEVQGTGLSRARAAVLRFSPDGARHDTVRAVRGPERVVQVGRRSRSEAPQVRTGLVPYGRTTLVAVRPAGLLLLDTEGCHVEWRAPDGRLEQRLDLRCTVELVTDATREEYRAALLRTARSASDTLLRERVARNASLPPAKATMADLRTDRAGRAWLGLPADADSTASIWWVFAADATPLARVGVPRPWTLVAVEDSTAVAVMLERPDALPRVARLALPPALHPTPIGGTGG
jgi:acetoin utilization deacetylase AcuC-like enzyme